MKTRGWVQSYLFYSVRDRPAIQINLRNASDETVGLLDWKEPYNFDEWDTVSFETSIPSETTRSIFGLKCHHKQGSDSDCYFDDDKYISGTKLKKKYFEVDTTCGHYLSSVAQPALEQETQWQTNQWTYCDYTDPSDPDNLNLADRCIALASPTETQCISDIQCVATVVSDFFNEDGTVQQLDNGGISDNTQRCKTENPSVTMHWELPTCDTDVDCYEAAETN